MTMIQKRMRQNSVWLLILISLVLVSGCANGKAMSQKQQATIWMDTYNAQFDDTMAIMTNPASTESQKAVALKKRAILIQVWPMLRVYADVVNKGGTPSEQSVQDITALINDLTAVATGGH